MAGETRWTPGPWEREAGSGLHPSIIRQGGRGAIIAEAYWDRDLMDGTDEVDANVALIAAAPDLYEAAETALATCSPFAAEKIRSALAKARGEEPTP